MVRRAGTASLSTGLRIRGRLDPRRSLALRASRLLVVFGRAHCLVSLGLSALTQRWQEKQSPRQERSFARSFPPEAYAISFAAPNSTKSAGWEIDLYCAQ